MEESAAPVKEDFDKFFLRLFANLSVWRSMYDQGQASEDICYKGFVFNIHDVEREVNVCGPTFWMLFVEGRGKELSEDPEYTDQIRHCYVRELPRVKSILLGDRSSLTKWANQKILKLITQNKSPREIAEACFVTEDTVFKTATGYRLFSYVNQWSPVDSGKKLRQEEVQQSSQG